MNFFNEYIIDKKLLIENVKKYNTKKLCAMVKADAYGLGTKNVVKIIDNYVHFYGVANCDEAFKLTKITKKPILICGKINTSKILKCLFKKIRLTVDCLNELKKISIICEKNNLTANVHLKVNTGMNRLGVKSFKEYEEMLMFIKMSKVINLEGVFTHFSSADCNKKYLLKQYRKFKKFISIIDNSVIIHCANTDASLLPKLQFDMVRIGIGLYSRCVSIISKVIKIQNVEMNEFVGYASSYYATKKIKVAVLPIGYADGIMRCYSNVGKVIINDKYYKIIGSVCMDMMFVEVDENVNLGDSVVIMGKTKNCEINESDIAKDCKTISYEIFTNFLKGRFTRKIL